QAVAQAVQGLAQPLGQQQAEAGAQVAAAQADDGLPRAETRGGGSGLGRTVFVHERHSLSGQSARASPPGGCITARLGSSSRKVMMIGATARARVIRNRWPSSMTCSSALGI